MSTGDNYLEWKRRATQAERERDEARRILSEAAPETLEEVVAAAVDCLDDGPRLAMAKHARRMETRAREEKAAREHAEKERNAARESADDWKTCYERAEADNAAKDRAFSEYVAAWGVDHEDVPGTDIPCPEDDACECPHIVALNAAFGPKHPGAALLERLHVAIAYAATGLREHHGHRCGMAGGPHPDNPRECNDAHCRQWAHDLDALKERTS
jgi:hypothetical protein